MHQVLGLGLAIQVLGLGLEGGPWPWPGVPSTWPWDQVLGLGLDLEGGPWPWPCNPSPRPLPWPWSWGWSFALALSAKSLALRSSSWLWPWPWCIKSLVLALQSKSLALALGAKSMALGIKFLSLALALSLGAKSLALGPKSLLTSLPASRSDADLLTYLGCSAAARGRDVHWSSNGRRAVEQQSNRSRIVVVTAALGETRGASDARGDLRQLGVTERRKQLYSHCRQMMCGCNAFISFSFESQPIDVFLTQPYPTRNGRCSVQVFAFVLTPL